MREQLEARRAQLQTEYDRGAAMLQLVMVHAAKKNLKAAQTQFAEMKKLNVTEPMLKEQIKEVDKQLKQAGQTVMNPATLAMMGGRGGFRPGSKQRMPRVR